MPRQTPARGPDLLLASEVARRLGIDRRTLLRWTVAGHIVGVPTEGGHHRYRAADVKKLLPLEDEQLLTVK